MKSLFTPLKEEDLTTLRINYNWKDDSVKLIAMKEWEPDTDFSRYNKDFVMQTILTEDGRMLNTKQVWEMFEKYELKDYLESVIDLLRQGRHFGIECYYYAEEDIKYMCNIHSYRRGIKNKQHPTLSGGIRRHSPEENEYEVIIDGLNLGRGSSFKAVVTGVPYGGCKSTAVMPPLDLTNMKDLGFLSFCIDRVYTHTGPDMNFPAEMADVINEHYSMQYTGGAKAILGPSGKPTAYGVYKTMKQALKFLYGTEELAVKSYAVMGLGAVGWHLANHILDEEGTKLYITDINPERGQEFIASRPDKDITWVDLADIYDLDADVLCPCAIGGILDDETIPKLKYKMIWGAANNQLKASGQEEEYRLAKLLAGRGILFQSEWWHNGAGLMLGTEEYMEGDNATYEKLLEKIDNRLPRMTFENLTEAKELGITPTENAYRQVEKLIYEGEIWDYEI